MVQDLCSFFPSLSLRPPFQDFLWTPWLPLWQILLYEMRYSYDVRSIFRQRFINYLPHDQLCVKCGKHYTLEAFLFNHVIFQWYPFLLNKNLSFLKLRILIIYSNWATHHVPPICLIKIWIWMGLFPHPLHW